MIDDADDEVGIMSIKTLDRIIISLTCEKKPIEFH